MLIYKIIGNELPIKISQIENYYLTNKIQTLTEELDTSLLLDHLTQLKDDADIFTSKIEITYNNNTNLTTFMNIPINIVDQFCDPVFANSKLTDIDIDYRGICIFIA